MMNQSEISEVFLVGFPGISENLHNLVSTMLFFIYMISLISNGSILCLVSLNTHLHQPMYLIIANLAASDILFDTITLPKLIARYWFGSASMNLKVCVFQLFCVHYLSTVDSFLLMLMAVDRYIAISQPLRYTLIITNKRTFIACAILWLFIATSTNTASIQASEIVLCRPPPNKINSIFCTHTALLALACINVSFMTQVSFVFAMVVLLVPLGLILLSYVLIIVEIYTSTRSENWKKVLYTCTTHLLVVALYYVPRVLVYIVTVIPVIIVTPDIYNLLLFLYSFIPRMANPIIYFLRTEEIWKTLAKLLQKMKYRVGHRFIS